MYRPVLPLIINRRIGGLESLSNDFSILEKINTLVTAYNDLSSHICEIEQSFDDENEKLQDINKSILEKTLNAKNILINLEDFITKYGDVTTLSHKIDNVTQTLNSLNERVTAVSNKIDNETEKIKTLDTRLTTLSNKSDNITQTLNTLDQRIRTLEANHT